MMMYHKNSSLRIEQDGSVYASDGTRHTAFSSVKELIDMRIAPAPPVPATLADALRRVDLLTTNLSAACTRLAELEKVHTPKQLISTVARDLEAAFVSPKVHRDLETQVGIVNLNVSRAFDRLKAIENVLRSLKASLNALSL